MGKDTKPKKDPAGEQKKPAKKSANVIVEVKQTIGFDGIVIRPIIDDKTANVPPVITPIRAVIPHALAVSYGDEYVKIVGAAPAGAKFGPVESKK